MPYQAFISEREYVREGRLTSHDGWPWARKKKHKHISDDVEISPIKHRNNDGYSFRNRQWSVWVGNPSPTCISHHRTKFSFSTLPSGQTHEAFVCNTARSIVISGVIGPMNGRN